MGSQTRSGVSTGFVLLLCGLFVVFPGPAMASKSSSKKSDVQLGGRMPAAAVPKDPRPAFSRISTRRMHGLTSVRPTNAAAMRGGLRRLNNARAMLGQREQLLDSSRIHVIDGDTFAYGAERIRIQGFNAAERSDTGGFEATERLENLLRHGKVTMIPKAGDIYGRIVAQVFVDGYDVAGSLR